MPTEVSKFPERIVAIEYRAHGEVVTKSLSFAELVSETERDNLFNGISMVISKQLFLWEFKSAVNFGNNYEYYVVLKTHLWYMNNIVTLFEILFFFFTPISLFFICCWLKLFYTQPEIFNQKSKKCKKTCKRNKITIIII